VSAVKLAAQEIEVVMGVLVTAVATNLLLVVVAGPMADLVAMVAIGMVKVLVLAVLVLVVVVMVEAIHMEIAEHLHIAVALHQLGHQVQVGVVVLALDQPQ
jgi:hypothetical protein